MKALILTLAALDGLGVANLARAQQAVPPRRATVPAPAGTCRASWPQ
jgi:hypothetical protein